ncbi:radical SAM protein [Coleofasciculus sp. FACHB-712]|uniref:radical SAM protein n=1 Tax=Coleofasciculus sp. FACHB-712 TaxID=2692789 RepID=UPI0016830629|nr:radical SAM protein [Coleofasciculus sp. FACHB-712]MBD1944478.1 radical SAM protein [Coleofasciculus sp. FACHB-712]
MPTRNYLFYALTNSVCSKCLVKVEAKIIFRDDCVYLVKHCPTHGHQEVLIADDIDYYKLSQEFIKPGDMPLKFNTPIKYGCPYDCGLCPDHEQHSCLTLVEVTDRCNLSCPICYADSGTEEVSQHSSQSRRHRTLEQIERMIDAVVANEGEPQVVQISGGEPTIHPEFFKILDITKSKPIRHLMINTNGIRIAKDRNFCDRLSQYMPGIEVYLQFDSFEAAALEELRGTDLREIREQAIAHLNEFNISTTLVVTLKKGLNDGEIGKIIEYALQQRCVRGVTFQPIQAAGRLEGFEHERDRYTLTEVRRSILQQSPYFKPEDILPVPCHPDCLAMAYALKVKGKVIPLTGLLEPNNFVKIMPNSVLYEQDDELKRNIFNLFSTSHSPASSATSLKQLLCCLPLLPVPEGITYENIFRVMIVQFLDPFNFDVRSVKRSCIHIVHPDGRIIPFDTFNMFYREGSAGYHLVNNRPALV